MKELIERLIEDRNLYEGRLCEMYFTTEQLDIIIQALTSVKSEQIPITEEHIKNAYNTTLDKLRLVKSESAEEAFEKIDLTDLYCCTRVWSAWGIGTMTQDDFIPLDQVDEFRESVLKAMHDFANAEKKQHAIDEYDIHILKCVEVFLQQQEVYILSEDLNKIIKKIEWKK